MDAMSCLAPQPATYHPAAAASPAYYTDAAIARALHHYSSMPMPDVYSPSPAASSSSPSSSSSLLADFPYGSGGNSSWFTSSAPAPAPPPTGLLTCDSVLVGSDAAPRTPSTPTVATTSNKRRVGLGVAAAGRPGKRRARASKRAPTTYISTDPSNFRLMVQHVTGVQAEPGADHDAGALMMPASFDASAAAALQMDCATFGGAFGDAMMPSGDADAAGLHHRLQQQQQQTPCFPTLDSWSVMYESTEML